jgi:phosphomannomutase
VGDSLTPLDVVGITAAFAKHILSPSNNKKLILIGRDARPSGTTISQLVAATLQNAGFDVLDLGLVPTPTLGWAISQAQAGGGIAITASHNPAHWNALKLFNQLGQYIDATSAQQIFDTAERCDYSFVFPDQLGNYYYQADYIDQHIAQILALPLVDVKAIRDRKLKVAVDAVNSVGGLAVPPLLQALGVEYVPLHCTPTGIFPHDPEPRPENLGELIALLQGGLYDMGIAVDPDADRLAIIDEAGKPWGEDYTLVAVADYVLSHTPGPTVSNLSSSDALASVTHAKGCTHTACAVGEMHVIATMKATKAVIGGEGNGGVIYPLLHYGRDALVGVALLLSYLAKTGLKASELRQQYPSYVLLKRKLILGPHIIPPQVVDCLKKVYQGQPTITLDGLKIIFEGGWLLIRQSNTEPIMRLYIEGHEAARAQAIATEVLETITTHFPAIQVQ